MKLTNIMLIIITSVNLYSLSVADLTLINEKNGITINYYDSANDVLVKMGGAPNYKEESEKNAWFINENDMYLLETRVLSGDYPIRGEIPEFYEISKFKAFADFKTYRGVKIGSSIQEVKNTYPDSIFYIPGENYLGDRFWDCENNSEVPEGLIAVIFWDFGNQKRAPDLKMDIEYGFTFHFDENGKVKEIELGFILTEL